MTDPEPEDVIWEQTLDGVWLCRVVRLTGSTGRLTVTDTRFTDTIILTSYVGLAYGAVFGPDVDDVAQWQEIAIAAVDGDPLGTHGRCDTCGAAMDAATCPVDPTHAVALDGTEKP